MREYNPLAIANTKLTSLVCDEATVELQTDSTLVQPLIPLAGNLEAKRYDICAMMNGKGRRKETNGYIWKYKGE